MELLTPQRRALDLGQGTRVQLSLQQGTASLSSWGHQPWAQPATLSWSQGFTCEDSQGGNAGLRHPHSRTELSREQEWLVSLA